MRISVALATFNGELFIDEQLASLARQAHLPHELVVCDDRSTDSTLERLQRFARSAPFDVKIFTNDRTVGVGDNFYRAASLCEGDFVAFCDQDDVWEERKLERCAYLLAKAPDLQLVMHTALVVDEHLRPTGGRQPNIRRDRILRHLDFDPLHNPPGYAQVFARPLLDLGDFWTRPSSRVCPYRMVHDEWVYFLAFVSSRIGLISEPLVRYRQHSTSVTGEPLSRLRDRRARRYGGKQEGYAAIAEACREYAGYLHALAERHPDPLGSRLLDAERLYASQGSAWSERANLYSAPRSTRPRELGAMVRRRRYGLRRHNLRPRSFVKDLGSLLAS